MDISTVQGNLLDQEVDAIVNPWNRNLIPWWLLLPQGVSGAIKKRAGVGPFIELRRCGLLPLGGAAVTGAGRLPHKAIIHVAGINHHWRSSEAAIRGSVASALREAKCREFQSIAIPLIGAGTGGWNEDDVHRLMIEECQRSDYGGRIVIVRYLAPTWPYGHCYCDVWNKSPETLEKQGVPRGYCGICDVCGKPGHIQHFPGAVPFTGAWCRKHYYRVMILHPMGSIGVLLWGACAMSIIGLIIYLVRGIK